MYGALIGTGMDIMNSQQQSRQAGIAHNRNKEMADHMHDISMKTWEKTNHKAQVEQMKKAGLNVGLMYGGSGGQSGQTTATAGASAPMPDVKIGSNTMAGMGIESQIEVNKAQADKLKAEADNIRGVVKESGAEDVRAKKFDNDINELYRDKIEEAKNVEWDRAKIKGEEENAAWEFKKAIEYGDTADDKQGPYTNENSRKGRARIAEMKMYEEDLRKAKLDGDIKEAEQVIKEFEASMARQGISPNSPWYAKLITDLLNKIGITDLLGIGQKEVRKEVIGK